MNGSMRKALPRGASADPVTLGSQLVAAVAESSSAELHELVDGAVQHLVAAVVRGDRDAVEALAEAIRVAADEVPPLDIPELSAALHRLAVLPRAADTIARVAPAAALDVLARAPAGSALREVLAVLTREAGGERRFLRAGEVHEAGEFTVSPRRVGQIMDELLEAGWVVQVVRHAPGPIRHYALSPVGAERVAAGVAPAVSIARPRETPPPERFRRFAPQPETRAEAAPKQGPSARERAQGKYGGAPTSSFFGAPT